MASNQSLNNWNQSLTDGKRPILMHASEIYLRRKLQYFLPSTAKTTIATNCSITWYFCYINNHISCAAPLVHLRTISVIFTGYYRSNSYILVWPGCSLYPTQAIICFTGALIAIATSSWLGQVIPVVLCSSLTESSSSLFTYNICFNSFLSC